MKKLLFKSSIVLFVLLLSFNLSAQAPNAIPYQAVLRDASGNSLANYSCTVRFTIHDATIAGTTVYQETQAVVTNALGIFVVNVGQGTVVSGTFSTLTWGTSSKFLQVEFAQSPPAYTDLGTTQLLSVPYAKYADKAGSATTATTASNGVPASTNAGYVLTANSNGVANFQLPLANYSVNVKYCIVYQGIYSTSSASSGGSFFLGQIIPFAGNFVPADMLQCNGQLLPINQYTALFSLLGTTYGGNGTTNFALPNLNGKTATGY